MLWMTCRCQARACKSLREARTTSRGSAPFNLDYRVRRDRAVHGNIAVGSMEIGGSRLLRLGPVRSVLPFDVTMLRQDVETMISEAFTFARTTTRRTGPSFLCRPDWGKMFEEAEQTKEFDLDLIESCT